MLVSCDTMVALPNAASSHQTLFAKNSDRPTEECQPLVQRDREAHPSGAMARCQFVAVSQVGTTYRHVGSRPYWCWGYEHGFNEHQVVIGNEGLGSKHPEFQEPKLVGMEILRLGLERGRTAAEAVEVMTALITRYGQGRFRNDAGVRTYDNGYLVADPREAYVIEAAGHEWAVQRVESTLGISNVYSVGTNWERLSPTAERHAIEHGWWRPESGRLNFAEAYSATPLTGSGSGARRRARSCTVLSRYRSQIAVRTMMALLRDHSDGTDPEEPFRTEMPAGVSICVHYAGPNGGNTAASLVADLCADSSRLPVYWCGFYSPCLGVFLPMFVEGEIPPVLAIGGAEPSDESPWWLFRRLERVVRQDPSGETAAVARAAWRELEEEWLGTAYEVAGRAQEMLSTGAGADARRLVTEYMHRNVDRALATVCGLLDRASVASAASVPAAAVSPFLCPLISLGPSFPAR